MKLLTFFTACLLAGLAYSAPASSDDDDNVVVTKEFFPESLAVYTAEHEIVKILVPLNVFNFEDDSDDDNNNDGGDDDTTSDLTAFFVEAETNDKGERVDKGIYIYKKKNAIKLLEHGRDVSAANDDTKIVYIAANDGIYTYNGATNATEKYGTITDSLIAIAKVNGSDVIYVLTDDHVLYKVTEEGTKKEKIEKVVNANQIILDYHNNLYYVANNEVFVLIGDEVKKFEGLPANPAYLKIINPPFVIEDGVPAIVNNASYVVYENGTVEEGMFKFEVKPSAYAMEGTLIQFYSYNKKLYEYNVLVMLLQDLVDDLKKFLNNKSDEIQSIATRSRSDLRA